MLVILNRWRICSCLAMTTKACFWIVTTNREWRWFSITIQALRSMERSLMAILEIRMSFSRWSVKRLKIVLKSAKRWALLTRRKWLSKSMWMSSVKKVRLSVRCRPSTASKRNNSKTKMKNLCMSAQRRKQISSLFSFCSQLQLELYSIARTTRTRRKSISRCMMPSMLKYRSTSKWQHKAKIIPRTDLYHLLSILLTILNFKFNFSNQIIDCKILYL